MGMSLRLWLSATLILKIGPTTAAEQDCQGEYSVSGMFLRGHTFKKVAVDFPSKCDMLCSQDIRCQSYNVIIGRHICELNNRTKETRPEDSMTPWDSLFHKFVGEAVRYSWYYISGSTETSEFHLVSLVILLDVVVAGKKEIVKDTTSKYSRDLSHWKETKYLAFFFRAGVQQLID